MYANNYVIRSAEGQAEFAVAVETVLSTLNQGSQTCSPGGGLFAALRMIVCGPHLACPPKHPRILCCQVQKSLALLTGSLPRQRLLHPPSGTAACQQAHLSAGWQAAVPDGGWKRRCLGEEPASKAHCWPFSRAPEPPPSDA